MLRLIDGPLALFEATMYLQRWETYQNRCDPTTVRQFVDISLQLGEHCFHTPIQIPYLSLG